MVTDLEKIILDEYPTMLLNSTDISTLMMIKCIKRRFVEQFMQGKIYFGTPQEWIGIENNGNKGQGDKLEGVFCSVNTKNVEELKYYKDKYTAVEYFVDREYSFFRRKETLNLRCFCLYGLDDNYFQKSIDSEGRSHYRTSISKDYFSAFSEYKTKEEYIKANPEDQPVVIFINNTRIFIERVCRFLNSLGVKDDEIIISPVRYINWYYQYEVPEDFPIELLYKDNYFSEQRELRIIVNSTGSGFLDYIKNNTTLDIGPINDISEVHEMYFDDMLLERVGRKGLMFSLPEPYTKKLEQLDFDDWLNLLNNVIQGYVTVKGKEGVINNWEEAAQVVIEEIEGKYNVNISVDKSQQLHMIIYDSNLQKKLDDKYLNNPNANFELKMQELLDGGFSKEVISNCRLVSDDLKKKGLSDYYMAKALFIEGRLLEAILAYLHSYKKDYKRIESMAGIASIFVFQEKYNKAISIYNLIQEEKGYDPKIYGNIGNCLIGLKQYDKAIKFLDKGLDIDNKDAYLYYTKGIALFYNNKQEESLVCMKKATELEPNNAKYQNELRKYFGV